MQQRVYGTLVDLIALLEKVGNGTRAFEIVGWSRRGRVAQSWREEVYAVASVKQTGYERQKVRQATDVCQLEVSRIAARQFQEFIVYTEFREMGKTTRSLSAVDGDWSSI